MVHNDDPTLRLLDPGEAAEFLGVKEQTLAVWRCARRYPLAYVRVGRLIRYREQDLIDFLTSRTVCPMADVGGSGGDGAAKLDLVRL